MLKCYHDGEWRFRRRQLAHRRGRRSLRRAAAPAFARRGSGVPARRLLAPRARGPLPPLARRPPARSGRPLCPGRPARARLHHHGHARGALAAARRGRLPARARPQGEAAMSRRFRLALPSKGRLHDPVLDLMRGAGFELEGNGRALYAQCSQWDVEVLFTRAEDMPAWAVDGAVEAGVATVEALDGGRVATSHPRITAGYFAGRGMQVETVAVRGSVELAPRLQAAEAVCDLVQSGETLCQNGLRPI